MQHVDEDLSDQNEAAGSDAIAIVGMSGRFPGARSIAEFWENQRRGTISISHFSQDELEDSFDAATREDPAFVRARAVLEDVGLFDAPFFGMHPREAALTDPQHRIFLEIAQEALDQAGIDPRRYPGLIGVFAGASMPTYLMRHVLGDRVAVDRFASTYQLGDMPTLVGSLPEVLASRVAYKLDLRGPAMTVQSACSTSLLAVAQACQSLLTYQCDAALAGGVSITFPQKRGYLWQDGGMGSRDGSCRPFDAAACGTVFGSGAGVVMLKRLEDALADRDEIHAVIRGAGVNNDGASKIGFTAPSAEGQAKAIAAALAQADVAPESIGYVELHGTATPLGDPIEFDGLMRAFGQTATPGGCALGSAKANNGHLDAAAGVTGLIRAALALRHAQIPPLAGFTAPNPHIALEGSPFRIERELTPWAPGPEPHRAGVSSFGVGGTNVHVVLEEAPPVAHRGGATGVGDGMQILPLSAANPEALEAMAGELADHLRAHPDLPLGDVAFTLDQGRSLRAARGAVVAASTQEAAERLSAFAAKGLKGQAKDTAPVIFMFPGQGSQYPQMARGLYQGEPVFRLWIDRGAGALKPSLGLDIRDLLYATASGDDDAPHPIRSTVFAQPALFLVQYALAQLFMAKGIRPDAMIGHSVGELVAACLAGVMRFEDGLALIARRAALMQNAPEGAMLAVRATEARLLPLLGDDLDLAAANAPELCVAAGPFEAVAALEARLQEAGIDSRRLHTSHAFHSRMMDPVVEGLQTFAEGMRFVDPAIPYVSSVSGEWVSKASDAAYWARHCRQPVRFADALQQVAGQGVAGDTPPILLEVGPGRALTTFATQGLARDGYRAAITSLPDAVAADRDVQSFHEALARLWTLGAPVDLAGLYGDQARRVALPSYPFRRQLHWIEAPVARTGTPQLQTLESEQAMTSTAPVADTGRLARLTSTLTALFEDLSGEVIGEADRNTPFLELGFDSLFLGQVAAKVQRAFGVSLVFRQLLSDITTLAALALYLDENCPPDPQQAAPVAPVVAEAAPAIAMPAMAMPAAVSDGATGMAATFQAQLSAMQAVIAQQLALMQGQGSTVAAPLPAPPVAAPALTPAPTPAPQAVAASPEPAHDAPSRFRPFNSKAPAAPVTDSQLALIAQMVARTHAQMPGSMAQTAQHRPYFADPRSVSGFRAVWKDMVFPVVAQRSKGSKIWDVDGNAYVDLVNGYGQTAFGHAPDFVQAAVARQLEEGFAIGPQTPLAGVVAAQFARMVAMERVTFCNTGSEAVMAAMRLARCVTGRETVVVFNNDYHGQFDEVLVKAGSKPGRAFPIAPGIPQESLSNMVVLPYGTPEALDWIRDHADDVAAVIVEPVQSRHPELLPFDFLRDLRALTADSGSALVFDEVVTGFRTHPGGMQAVLGISADMATYGKVVGGGMPVGILAGAARFMDALDGGGWNFGDDSAPEVAPTFFAGTFVRHPLVMAACRAVLDHLDAEGPQLQERLTARTAALVARMNALFASKGVPSRIETYSSWFMLNLSGADKLGALFHYNMRLLGVHVLDGYPCFLTTAHSDEDIEQIFEATRQTIDLLQTAGILVTEGHVPPSTEPREVPLTEPQLEILLSAQMGEQASCAYNESITLAFDGAVDPERLKGAIDDVVARHDALRGTVPAGRTVLSIAPGLTITLPVIESADDAMIAACKAEEAATPFDLAAGPLIRACLFLKEDGGAALIVTAHHIVFDGWTANLFAQEVAAFYRARVTGSAPVLDPVQSFADYALAKARDTGAKAANEGWWRDTYATLPPSLDLRGDRPRPAVKSFNGATMTASIDAALMRDARKAGAKLGCTLFATLLGALQVTLGRLAEREDVVIGCPMAGQSLVEGKALAGHCVNFLPLRAPFSMAAPLGEHLRSVGAILMEAFDHQDYTYGALVRALGLPRDPNRTPLCDVQFNLERLGEDIDFAGAKAQLLPNPKAASNFDLFFNMVESTKGLRIDVDYATDLFDEATIARWVDNLRQVLRALVADPGTAIGALDLLGEEERRWLLAQGETMPRLPDDATLPKHFAAAVARHGAHQAVVCEGDALSYAELDGRANRLARALAARGIGKGDSVALLADRSMDTIAAILGVLKAGAAYVPLDPAFPAARQLHILRDAKAALALIGPGGEEAAQELGGEVAILPFTALAALADDQPATAPEVNVSADDPAYIMYTSGSTGQPKGVVVPHRAVVRLVSDQQFIAFGPDQVFLHLAPLAFDASTLEIWGALLHGGALAVVAEAKPSLARIGQAIAQHGVTTAWFTAALFHALVDEGVQVLTPLRQILAGGDVLSPAHLRKAQAALPHARIVNGYGPTENTTFSACYPLPPEGWGRGAVPIGTAIAHSTAYIMDADQRLAPRGAVGELLVGGEGLALGYLGQSDLTAQRFVPHPFVAGERLYRTGDLARWRNDGVLEFLGRVDGQVKINGHRIEPGEIESVLRDVPGIADAAVTVVESDNGTRQLHAFVVAEEPRPGLIEEAGAQVARLLPRPMHPRTIRTIGQLPLTANGKLDRALLAILGASPVAEAVEEAPRPAPHRAVELLEIEAKIGAIWADVLGLDSVATGDALFDLGAESLQIFRIVARMTDIGLPLESRSLLANPTLGEVAAMLASGEAAAPRPASVIVPLSSYRRGLHREIR
ncbi:hybrid non-ribosomal peptide synthetase/type I polyketide synthase [Novosphingobium rosa]|uniref:hybrid non-ribosomal peptide synthetase/type I polyketide synthase n=1 Tax=Novosphingobium rosa TaxID=76978 RepID=UPI000834DFC0|nr:hybrid non-ribosomal peptide synthetase/type I polyketide synthase [Novosphingobium rosa]